MEKKREKLTPQRVVLVVFGAVSISWCEVLKAELNGKGAELAWVQDPPWLWALLRETQWLLWQKGRANSSEKFSLVRWLTSSSGREGILKVNIKWNPPKCIRNVIPLIYRSPKRLPKINYFNLYIVQPWTDSSSFEVFLNSHCTKPSSFPYAKKWIENHNFSQWLWSLEKTHRTLQANLRHPAKPFNWVPVLLVPRISVALQLLVLSTSAPKESREGVWARNSLWKPAEIVIGTWGEG